MLGEVVVSGIFLTCETDANDGMQKVGGGEPIDGV